MHILANGAGRNLRSTIMNHLNIRIMKEQILKKIGKTLVRINVTDQSAEDAYDELVNSSPRLFGMLSSIYRRKIRLVCRNRLKSPYACREQ